MSTVHPDIMQGTSSEMRGKLSGNEICCGMGSLKKSGQGDSNLPDLKIKSELGVPLPLKVPEGVAPH